MDEERFRGQFSIREASVERAGKEAGGGFRSGGRVWERRGRFSIRGGECGKGGEMGKGRFSISSSRFEHHRAHNRVGRDLNRPSLHASERTTNHAQSARFEVRVGERPFFITYARSRGRPPCTLGP